MYPFVNLASFKPEATLDRVKILVTLSRASQHRHIQAKLHGLLDIEMVKGHCIRVEPMNKAEKGNNATQFWFELHDHQHGNNAAKIRHAVLGLQSEYGFAAPACTILAEPALDFWPEQENAAPLVELTKLLQMTIAAYGDNPRQYDPGTGETPGLLEHPEPMGTTYYVNHQKARKGRAASDIAWRVYHKTTDRKDESGEAIPLPPDQHRVRAEVTLQGAALKKYGLADPLALERCDFEGVAGLLHFRRLLPASERLNKTSLRRDTKKAIQAALATLRTTGRPTPPEVLGRLRFQTRLVGVIQEQLSQEVQCHVTSWPHGLASFDPRAKGGRKPRQHSIHTVPHEALNKMAGKALSGLAKSIASVHPSSPKKRARAC